MNKYLKDLEALEGIIPAVVIADVKQRISDWLSSGGSLNDEYVKRQYEYIERVKERGAKRGKK